MPHIEVRDVSLTYDTPAGRVAGVQAASFDIAQSEFLCIVGPSGCGKSTLLNIIAGFLSPTGGEIRIGGKPVNGHGLDRGVVFQDFAQLFPWRTALGNVSFGLEMKGVPKAERDEIARNQLRLVKLEKFTDAYPHHLSGGMQQRVAIARALAYNPAVLLMDEPFAALDALTRDDMQRLLAEVWKETKKTIIYVTHNVAEAVYLADRVIVMSPHPGTVKAQIEITLPRPRDPLSVEFLEFQKQLLNHLGDTKARKRPRRRKAMTQISRRDYLAASGAFVAAALAPRAAFAQTVIRQGYQTNLWGMPTYYLLRSGLLEKRGIKFEEFGVPSGNLTMQQMVARQVDMGTYAGPSLILGHDKGGLVAIAQIEHVGKTASVMVRKDLNLTKIEQLKGLKIANQTGSSVGNIFVDQIGPKHGLKKGDYQEVRMNVDNMITALSAKTVDAMVNVEPYNTISEADGLATKIMNYYEIDKMPVFMAATPDFIQKSPDAVVNYLKAWLEVAKDFKTDPTKVADAIYAFYTSKGYTMSQDTFRKAMATVDVEPGFPDDLKPYMQEQAEILLREKKIAAIPDWSKALRPDFMEKARAGA